MIGKVKTDPPIHFCIKSKEFCIKKTKTQHKSFQIRDISTSENGLVQSENFIISSDNTVQSSGGIHSVQVSTHLHSRLFLQASWKVILSCHRILLAMSQIYIFIYKKQVLLAP